MHYVESNNDSTKEGVLFSEKTTYEHNDNGNLIKEFSYNRDLNLYQFTIYEFESGKLIKISFYEVDDLQEQRLIRTNIFEYDTSRNIINEFIYKSDDSNKKCQVLHRCYPDGNKFEEIHYDSNKNIEYHVNIDYDIDSNDINILNQISFHDSDENIGRNVCIRYMYNEDNNLVKLTYVESRSNLQEIVVYHQN